MLNWESASPCDKYFILFPCHETHLLETALAFVLRAKEGGESLIHFAAVRPSQEWTAVSL